MRDFIKMFKSLIKKGIIIAIILYPLLGLVQWISPVYIAPVQVFHNAIYYLWVELFLYGDWLLIIYLAYKLSASPNAFYEAAEKIRMNRLIYEYNRWAHTPYISPLHFFYLVSPQTSYSPSLKDVANNRFYQRVVDLFRDRIYINANYETDTPDPKPTIFQVAGKHLIASVAVGITVIITFFIYLAATKDFSLWFTGYERFAIPFLIAISSWVGQQLYAIMTIGGGKDLEATLRAYYGEEEPKITWRELFPDKPGGQVILNAWQAEREKRQRNYYYLQNLPIPADNNFVFNSPALAPFPFPANEVPDWVTEVEDMYAAKQQEWRYRQAEKTRHVVKESKGKVVAFKTKKIR
ncbi:hypothetical protein ABEV55_18430 [Aneurinibacillus thermoaerophilus]|uniref:hypothetical protein n=1 Tax=Aneurinibacillus thermoaerophilus TaxID=143495 RepID=UPI002E1E5779|nr:hypothetical protein [Aneurinibacillus thermoaerophilus]